MPGEQGERGIPVGRANQGRWDVIQEGVDGARGHDDGRNGGQRYPKVQQCRRECEENEGDVVDVKSWNKAGERTEHDPEKQGSEEPR